jgi:2-polyprenyl-3-methyl-5-hydroxy-6-metoxy-1,4-benzoquinol methylase
VDTALAEFAAETGILAAAADFPKKCGDLVLRWAAEAGAATGRALDLGCAVGRSSFEMAREYREVVGIDISQTFVDGGWPALSLFGT